MVATDRNCAPSMDSDVRHSFVRLLRWVIDLGVRQCLRPSSAVRSEPNKKTQADEE